MPLSHPLHVHSQTLSALRFGERCSNIVNRAALSAMSVADAIKARSLSRSWALCASATAHADTHVCACLRPQAIDAALSSCQETMRRQESSGITHLPAYKRLRNRYQQLLQRRRQLDGQE